MICLLCDFGIRRIDEAQFPLVHQWRVIHRSRSLATSAWMGDASVKPLEPRGYDRLATEGEWLVGEPNRTNRCPRFVRELFPARHNYPTPTRKKRRSHWDELGRAGCSPRRNLPVNQMF
jgi:hypothetical protein